MARVVGRLALISGLLFLLSGCAELRIPAIDPTGSCIFAPTGASTTLLPACPLNPDGGSCLNCRGCLSGGCCLAGLGNWLPEPAFPEPTPPPPCLQGPPVGGPQVGAPLAAGPGGGPCVPGGAPYSEDCAKGPPAVLVGQRGCLQGALHLPKQGKRGRLLLSPGRVIAPVGGEVVLLSGVCGNDGYLTTGEPIEWMLTPESVGHFIQIAPDDANLLQRWTQPAEVEKVSGSFARGLTRTKPALITRGTLTPNDDVQLEAGQAWATISSPTEGVSRITALAPESDCWDQRKATTTIYWVDARWTFPRPQIERAGTPVSLTTRVTRSEGTIPAVGWKVQYTILNPELAGFAPNGSATIESTVSADGNATVSLVPLRGTSGTATVAMQVIRPAGIDDNIPALPLAQGTTLVTWSAPRLALEATGPAVAGFDQPITITANVSNPGNLATGPVDLSVQLPVGVKFLGSDFEHQEWPNQITWSYPEGVPGGQVGTVTMRVSAREPFQLVFNARDAQNGLTASSEVRVDVSIPSLEVRVQVAADSERLTTGEDASFNIEVINTGQRPLQAVELKVEGDEGMAEVSQGTAIVFNGRDDPLQPGDVWRIPVRYNVFQPGRRCLTVTASAQAQAPVSAQACLTATNPIPQAPAIEASISGPPEVRVNDVQLFRYVIRNTGQQAVSDVLVTVTYDAQLQSMRATSENRDDQNLPRYQLKWRIPSLPARSQTEVEVEYQVLGPLGPASTIMTVQTAEGAQADDRFEFQIFPAPPAVAPPAAEPPPVLPSGPPPRIPTPLNPYENQPNDAVVPPPLQEETPPVTQTPAAPGRLSVRVFDNDDPVKVGDQVTYVIQLTNESASEDREVQVRFSLRPDVPILSISQTRFPGAVWEKNLANFHYLREIPSIAPGETIEYTLVVQANSPQAINVLVEAYSRNQPTQSTANEETSVLPQ